MFRQVTSPAYGTGIASNLVSNEERQRYNSGGRVGLAYGQPWQDFKWDQPPGFQEIWKGSKKEGTWQDTQKAKSNLNRMLEYAEPFGEWTGSVRQSPQYIDSEEGLPLQYGVKISGVGDDVEAQDVYQGSDPRYFKPTHRGVFVEETDVRENQPYNQDDIIDDSGKKEVVGTQQKKTVHDDSMWNRKQNTDDLDTDADGWATLMGELDKDIEKKKQLGKGNALMQAAAAAVKWGGAPTAEKRAAAISEGLTQVGETAMKAAAEGMDLKNRAKILKGIEDVKNKKAITVQEMRGSQAMDRLKENITYLQSVSDKDGKKLGISDQFKFTLSDPKISNDPLLSVSALQTVAQGEDIDINTETLDMSKPESLTKKFPPGTIIRDTKPTGKWYIAGEDGTVDQTKGYTYKAIGDWVESQAPDK